jgi:hypothetical protein
MRNHLVNALIYVLVAGTGLAMLFIDDGGPLAFLVVTAMSLVTVFLIGRFTPDAAFLIPLFLTALSLRLIFGMLIHTYDLREFVGPDSIAYDDIGNRIADHWRGTTGFADSQIQLLLSIRGPGWGMNYLMGGLYYVFGQSIFLAQSFCAVFGAATTPVVYVCAKKIFQNQRVARSAAVLVAFFPAFIIWSGQLLKDGLIVFLIVLAITCTLDLQRRLSYGAVIILVSSLSGILSLRFYIFYMVAVAVFGSFIVGVNTSVKAILQRSAVLVVVAIALTYLGVIRTAAGDFATYGSLERVQVSRSDLVQSAGSGFGGEQNVSTFAGAVKAVPVGFIYLMFAPFPWDMKNLRQLLTLPDILLWWTMWPLIIYGAIYTLKHKLRPAFPVLIFSTLLTISYSVFQGNVGAAYRQRTQIQVFLFLFVAVGVAVLMERRADRKLLEERRIKEMVRRQRAILEQSPQI